MCNMLTSKNRCERCSRNSSNNEVDLGGHVAKMTDDRWTKKLKEWCPGRHAQRNWRRLPTKIQIGKWLDYVINVNWTYFFNL